MTTRVRICMICERATTSEPELAHLKQDELLAILETEHGRVSSGLCDECKDIPPDQWPSAGKARLINEIMSEDPGHFPGRPL